MPTPVLIALIALGGLIALALLIALTFRFTAPLLAKTSWGRRLLVRISRLGVKLMSARARRDGNDRDELGLPLSDMEIAMRGQDSDEARQMTAMISSLPAGQRAQVRRMMDQGDIDQLAAGLDADELPLGRSERRRVEQMQSSRAGSRTLTPAQQKAKQKARAARKGR